MYLWLKQFLRKWVSEFEMLPLTGDGTFDVPLTIEDQRWSTIFRGLEALKENCAASAIEVANAESNGPAQFAIVREAWKPRDAEWNVQL